MNMVRSLTSLIAALLLVSSASFAQVGSFQEVSVPTQPTDLYIGPGDYYQGADVFVRFGQQGVRFDLGSNIVQYLKVRVNGGAWTYLHQGGNTQAVTWAASQVAALGGPSVYPVDVNYGGTGTTYSFNLIVVPPAQRAFVSQEPNTYDPRTGTTGTLHHTMLVWQGGASSLDKPLLVVEGIDASNENGPAAYYALGARPTAQLFPRGQAEGADIVILDFGDGGRTLQANAAVARQAIILLRSYASDPNRSLDVAGISMGGVVARYALAEMEEDGVSHRVGTFVSIDAPHRGAVIHGTLQHDIKNRQDPSDWPDALARPAGRQLLVYNAFDTTNPTEHQRFYAELRALNGGYGYPRLTQNVGVSFGTPNPNPNPGQRWARLDVSGPCNVLEYGWPDCDDHNYNVGGDHGQAGSYLPLKVTQLWGRRAWGTVRYELLRYPPVHPTFMPFTSALDMVNGVSAFDQPLIHRPTSATPSFHNIVPDELVEPLLHRLGYELPPPPSVSISGPSTLSTNQYGYWRASTPDPGAGYEYNWEYRTFLPSCGGSLNASTAEPFAELQKSGDPPSPNALPCGEWHSGYGSGVVFRYKSQSSLRLELRVRATGGGASVTSPIKVVCVGDCYGDGPLVPNQASEDVVSASATMASAALKGAAPPVMLEAIYPNPFGAQDGSRAILRYAVPEAGPVRLRVFDTLGREVARLRDETVGAGTHEAVWNAAGLPPGVYVVQLEAGGTTQTQLVTYSR
jgi:hypothetical protein